MADGRSPRVLVIDDDPSVRQVVRFLLAAFGYESHPAADGPSGLAQFVKGGWDLVITDLEMPEMSGWHVIEAIRQRDATMPILIITAFSDPGVLQQASEWGITVVAKPFAMATLKVAVEGALRGHAS
jgi:two-component system chemotaxis response regulator CheY